VQVNACIAKKLPIDLSEAALQLFVFRFTEIYLCAINNSSRHYFMIYAQKVTSISAIFCTPTFVMIL
jgi:hypothetical protein